MVRSRIEWCSFRAGNRGVLEGGTGMELRGQIGVHQSWPRRAIGFGREFEKRGIKTGVKDLQRRAHGGSRLARAGAKSLGHLAFGSLDGGLEFGRELQVVFDHVVHHPVPVTFAQYVICKDFKTISKSNEFTNHPCGPRFVMLNMSYALYSRRQIGSGPLFASVKLKK